MCASNTSDSLYYSNNNFESADIFNWIRQDCVKFISKGTLLLMGDLNAYLPKHFADYVDNDAIDIHVPLPVNIYNPDPAMPRNTLEVRNIHQNGRLLLEMCKSVPVRILNGRTFGDTIVNFTKYPTYNYQNESQSLPSVIDYALADPACSLFTKIKHFSVSNMTRFSDHCSVKQL